MQEIFRVRTPAKYAIVACSPKKKEEKRRELCWTSCLIKCLSKFMYKHMQPCLLTCCQLIKLIKTFKNCFRSLHNAAIGDLFAIMRKGFGCWCIYALSKFYTLYKMIYLLNFMHKIVSCFNCLGFFIIYLFILCTRLLVVLIVWFFLAISLCVTVAALNLFSWTYYKNLADMKFMLILVFIKFGNFINIYFKIWLNQFIVR